MAQLNPQHNQFVWVDIPVADLDRAIAFYAAVLAAPVTHAGGPGFHFGLLPYADSGVGGCLVPSTAEHTPSRHGPLVYLNAAGRLHEALRQVEKNGGSVIQGVHQIGEHGWRAIVTDSEGNRVALHAPRI